MFLYGVISEVILIYVVNVDVAVASKLRVRLAKPTVQWVPEAFPSWVRLSQ